MTNSKSFIFTKASLVAIKPESTRQYYHDTKERRLGLYVTPAGHKSFFARLTIRGKTIRRKLGNFPDVSLPLARKLVVEARSLAADGGDPLEERRASVLAGITLQEVLDAYLASHELKASTQDFLKRDASQHRGASFF